MSTQKRNLGKGLMAISPIVVFLAVYLISSIVAKDFYKVPVASAFLIASAYAIITTKGSMEERIRIFSDGAADRNLLLMVWIFIMAGAFAGTAKEIGSVEATVNFTLSIIPGKALLAGFFLTSCFVSMAIGTSVGTIVALVPIANGIAAETGIGAGHMTAIIVGGAFFGDNLSFISDTTIAATRAMGCAMKDKFKANLKIVAPAVLAVTVIYVIQGIRTDITTDADAIEWAKLVPYISVIVLAISGMNVIAVLATGIVINAAVGFMNGLDWFSWLGAIGSGIAGMGDLIVVTLLAGGMLSLIRYNQGLDIIMEVLTRRANGKRGAELCIAALTSLANLCTANNTIAIITTGGISRNIADKFGIDPKRGASLMDTFSCMVQGLIPYGAQLLMASGLSGLPATAIIPYLYYPVAVGIAATLSIVLRRNGRQN
ncbi:MAG: Na+/H+ antiporter NhaC family protein [Bacteroidaceae bacterium]|nr:Na+/H+ antiporter NhaC family protein [Bacteroidaceae bacterium]